MCYSLNKNKENKTPIFTPILNTVNVLRRFIPCGKVAVFASDEIDFLKVSELRKSLKGFESYLAILGKSESVSGLFSLPDDVRAVIAVGEKTFHFARYFCTLRGAYCLCLPERADCKNLFDSPVKLNVWNTQSLYPADIPNAVICDTSFIKDYGAAYCTLALCGAQALDFQVNSVFSGGSEFSVYSLLYNLLANLDCKDEQGILNLYFQFLNAEENTKLRTPSAVFCKLLQKRTGIDGAQAAYFTYCYYLVRYKYFFDRAKPRTFYVPDYANRIRHAALLSGEDERALFLKNKVPTAKRTDALYNTFCETRKTFAVKCESALAYHDKIKKNALALGVKASQVQSVDASELFSASAELSDILSVPTLMRDFGLLCAVKRT